MIKKVLELRFEDDEEIPLGELMKRLENYSDEYYVEYGSFHCASKCIVKKVKTKNGYEEMFFREKVK